MFQHTPPFTILRNLKYSSNIILIARSFWLVSMTINLLFLHILWNLYSNLRILRFDNTIIWSLAHVNRIQLYNVLGIHLSSWLPVSEQVTWFSIFGFLGFFDAIFCVLWHETLWFDDVSLWAYLVDKYR